MIGQLSKKGSTTIQVEGWDAIQVAIYRKEDPPGKWIKRMERERESYETEKCAS